jgi:hypothetical protein
METNKPIAIKKVIFPTSLGDLATRPILVEMFIKLVQIISLRPKDWVLFQ